MDGQLNSHVVHEQWPPPDEQVIVRCLGFQCLGSCDANHKWHSVFSHEELSDVEAWSRLSDDKFVRVNQRGPHGGG